jgi:tetratricopeptide (TPR) repeat protein
MRAVGVNRFMRRAVLLAALPAVGLVRAQGPAPLLPGPAAAVTGCEAHIAQGLNAAAKSCLERLLARRPDQAEAHAQLALVLQSEGSRSDAVRHLERARALAPTDFRHPWNLSQLYIEQQRNDEAIDAMRAAVELEPTFLQSYRSLAALLRDRQRPGEAVEVMEEYLRRAPGDADAMYFLGALETERSRLAEAEGWMRRALQADPNHGQARYGLGLILSHDPQRVDQALEHLALAAQAASREPLIPYLIGTLKLQRGEVAGAIESLERARELDPAAAHVLYSLAQAYMRAGRREQAQELLRRFQREKASAGDRDARQRQALAAFGRGRELLDQGDLAGAAGAFREAAGADPSNARTWAQLGKVELSLELPEAALESLGMARGLAAGESEFAYLESLALLRLGRAQEALAAIQSALELDPSVGAFHNQHGLVLQKLDRLEQAISAYRLASERSPEDPVFQLNLAMALQAAGDAQGYATAMRRYEELSRAPAPPR